MHFTHDCTLVLYTQLIQTGSVLMLLPFSTELGFTLHRDTANGRAATHQLYSFAIEIGFAPMVALPVYRGLEGQESLGAKTPTSFAGNHWATA